VRHLQLLLYTDAAALLLKNQDRKEKMLITGYPKTV
jgi:hypothetical protein